MPEELLARVQHTLASHHLVSPGSRVVVAVSGGADSVGLLHLLLSVRASWSVQLHVAHLDHGLREGARADAKFVQALAKRWELPVTVERRDVRAACAREGWSLEDGARRTRYQYLLEVALRQSASAVAVAHTADDQAETVLMRLIRGAGLLGLAGMSLKRRLGDGVWLVRPLLGIWRHELLAQLRAAGLTYRDDAMNEDRRFLRNRIRHDLLPLLERDYNPNMKGALTQLAEQSRCDAAYLAEAAGRQWKRLVRMEPSRQAAISIVRFRRQPKALQRQLVREVVARVQGDLTQFEFRHWLEIEQLFASRPSGTRVRLPSGIELRRDHDRVVCSPVSSAGHAPSLG